VLVVQFRWADKRYDRFRPLDQGNVGFASNGNILVILQVHWQPRVEFSFFQQFKKTFLSLVNHPVITDAGVEQSTTIEKCHPHGYPRISQVAALQFSLSYENLGWTWESICRLLIVSAISFDWLDYFPSPSFRAVQL
jgi:hypothetical protein